MRLIAGCLLIGWTLIFPMPDAGAADPDMPPPLDAAAALATLRVPPGLRVELVAAEPLIADPVAFAWGFDGKLWVVEMADYPLGIDGKGTFGGRVRWLEDTDGDGRYDRSTLFLEGLGFPTGIVPYRNGVLVCCAPELLYAEDADGDGRADVRQPLYTGFSEGNQQHRFNGLRWGLDNWIYCANAQSKGKVTTASGQTVDISNRDFRIHPGTARLETVTGRSQFMRERDDWGNWFGNTNSNPLFHFVMDDRYLSRNPHLPPPPLEMAVSETPGAATIFPTSRTLERFNSQNKVNRFTSACSAMIYRDNLLGDEYAGNSFVCEPVHNLVHREVVEPRGLTFTSHRAASEQRSEFLTSTDNWFRPAMIRTGPDGALYVADMYRFVIEHPEWIPDDWEARLDLRAGADKGRIYRIVPEDRPPRAVPRLDRLATPAVVKLLASPSGTLRDMAQQWLVEHGDEAAFEPLRAMLAGNKLATARLHALCTLDGLAALDDVSLTAALADKHPAVRRHAVRLAEARLDEQPQWLEAVKLLAADDDMHVRLQVACSLGESSSAELGGMLATLAIGAADDVYLTAAVLSSLRQENATSLLGALLNWEELPQPGLIEKVLLTAAAADWQAALGEHLPRVVQPGSEGEYAYWQMAGVRGLLDGLSRRKQSLDSAAASNAAVQASSAQLTAMLSWVRTAAAADSTPLLTRTLAMSLLGRQASRRGDDVATLASLLSPQAPSEVQHAAIARLAQLGDEAAAVALLNGWGGYGPAVRAKVLDVLSARPAWLGLLLDAIEAGQVPLSAIDVTRAAQWLEHPDEPLRQRAAQLLADSTSTDRAAVVAHYEEALRLTGDAAAGAAVFKKSCSACHRLDEVGHEVGPDLAALTDRSPRTLLVAVLDPNKAVEARYVSYTAITADGLTHTGLLTAESSTSITLTANEGKQVQLLRGELELLTSTAKSLMPEGVEKDIPTQAMADLLAYLAAAGPQRKVFPGNEPRVVEAEALRGEFWLLANLAEIYGDTLAYEPRLGNLGQWRSGNDFALWRLNVARGGKYQVYVEYACDAASAGQGFQLLADAQRMSGIAESTGNWTTYDDVRLGPIQLEAGARVLVLRSDGKLNRPLFDVKTVRLMPIP